MLSRSHAIILLGIHFVADLAYFITDKNNGKQSENGT